MSQQITKGSFGLSCVKWIDSGKMEKKMKKRTVLTRNCSRKMGRSTGGCRQMPAKSLTLIYNCPTLHASTVSSDGHG